MARGYFATLIGDTLQEMPDGTLVAPGCVIARTGSQVYQVKDLPQEAAAEFGVDTSNPNANITLWRSPEEVFHPDTVRSFEARPLTDNHPPDFVDPSNFTEYARGHIQNVRKGTEPLESGEWPLLADLIIAAEPLLSKVKTGQLRELSCGYDYSIRQGEGEDEGKIFQCDIIGNHLAVVPKGRAGSEARINDAAPASLEEEVSHAPPTDVAPERASPPPLAVQEAHDVENKNVAVSREADPEPKKEKSIVKNWRDHIFGLGLRAKAADAETSPEELAEAAKAVGESTAPPADDKAKDKKGKDSHGKDESDPAIKAEPDDDHEDDIPGEDRKKAHDALDRMLDRAKDKKGKDARGKDTDLEALKELLGEFLSEEEEEPTHASEDNVEADPSELDNVLSADAEPPIAEEDDSESDPGEVVVETGEEELEPGAEDEAEMGECAHCGTAHDAESCPECGCRDRKADDKKHMGDRARAADGVRAVLKMLKPVVARSNDTAVKKAFNTAINSYNSRSTPSSGSYGKFARNAAARDGAPRNPNPERRARAADKSSGGKKNSTIDELQAAYDSALKGGK